MSTSRLVAIVVAVVLPAALLGGCGGGSKSGSKSHLLDYNRDQPLAAQVTASNPIAGDEALSVTYTGAQNDRVTGILALPPGGSRVSCVMYLHGLGGSKNDGLPFVGPLAKLGIGLLAIDAPYQGARSQGKAALNSVLHSPARLTAMVRQTALDARRGLDFLENRRECDPHRLGLIGFSFGGVVAAAVAGSDTRVRSTILLSVSGSFATALSIPGLVLARSQVGRSAVDATYEQLLAPYNPARWVGQIAPRPVLMVNGYQDPTTTVAAEKELHNAAGKNSEVMWYTGGHDPFSSPQASQIGQRIVSFLSRSLASQ